MRSITGFSGRLAGLAVVLAAQFLAIPAAAAPPPDDKTPIFVSHSGEDEVGVLFVQSVREALTAASSLAPAGSADQADMALLITTLNPNAARPGIETTAAWTLVIMKDVRVYVASGLRLCDRERLRKSAGELAAHVEVLLKDRKVELPGSAERQRYQSAWEEAVEKAAATIPVDACGIKARTAFQEQLETYFRLSGAANLKLDVNEVIKSVLSNFSTEDAFTRKLETQSARLAQCQADLAAARRTAGGVKK